MRSFHQERCVISTAAAHGITVRCVTEKSAVALALLVVIPEGDLLLPWPYLVIFRHSLFL
jgi:hypothetical protein